MSKDRLVNTENITEAAKAASAGQSDIVTMGIATSGQDSETSGFNLNGKRTPKEGRGNHEETLIPENELEHLDFSGKDELIEAIKTISAGAFNCLQTTGATYLTWEKELENAFHTIINVKAPGISLNDLVDNPELATQTIQKLQIKPDLSEAEKLCLGLSLLAPAIKQAVQKYSDLLEYIQTTGPKEIIATTREWVAQSQSTQD